MFQNTYDYGVKMVRGPKMITQSIRSKMMDLLAQISMWFDSHSHTHTVQKHHQRSTHTHTLNSIYKLLIKTPTYNILIFFN